MAQPTPRDDVVHDFKECFKLLLNGRDVYSHDPARQTLAFHRKEAVSLSDDAGEARDFTTFGREACKILAEEEGVQMLRDPVDTKQNPTDPGFSLHSDPIFKRERGKYVGFVSRHLVHFGTWRREGITPFFVWKKGRKNMRIILDCRPSNLWFKRPPPVQLVTGEGLANLDVETDKTGNDAGLRLGQADVKDAFDPLGMPIFLSRYFGYPG